MRSRVAHVAVFVCVFCLFLGYCEWWKSQSGPDVVENVHAYSPPDASAYLVQGAADETFNGVYVPMSSHDGVPCFMKEAPRRFLWRSGNGWHLSTEPLRLADGYRTAPGAPVSTEWIAEGGDEPAPTVTSICEFAADAMIAAATLPGGTGD